MQGVGDDGGGGMRKCKQCEGGKKEREIFGYSTVQYRNVFRFPETFPVSSIYSTLRRVPGTVSSQNSRFFSCPKIDFIDDS